LCLRQELSEPQSDTLPIELYLPDDFRMKKIKV
jgi:hypothetical protein